MTERRHEDNSALVRELNLQRISLQESLSHQIARQLGMSISGRATESRGELCIKTREGKLKVPEAPWLGVELDMAKLEEAHQLYRSLDVTQRNDAMAMQYLISGWEFDPKKPALAW